MTTEHERPEREGTQPERVGQRTADQRTEHERAEPERAEQIDGASDRHERHERRRADRAARGPWLTRGRAALIGAGALASAALALLTLWDRLAPDDGQDAAVVSPVGNMGTMTLAEFVANAVGGEPELEPAAAPLDPAAAPRDPVAAALPSHVRATVVDVVRDASTRIEGRAGAPGQPAHPNPPADDGGTHDDPGGEQQDPASGEDQTDPPGESTDSDGTDSDSTDTDSDDTDSGDTDTDTDVPGTESPDPDAPSTDAPETRSLDTESPTEDADTAGPAERSIPPELRDELKSRMAAEPGTDEFDFTDPEIAYFFARTQLTTETVGPDGSSPADAAALASEFAEAIQTVEVERTGERLEPMGFAVSVDVELEYLANEPMLLTWSLRGNGVPGFWTADTVAVKLVAETDHDTGTAVIWVPDLDTADPYVLNVELAYESDPANVFARGAPFPIPPE